MITIVDYGIGNIGSIKNMLKKIGAKAEITSDLELISNSEKLILPGVGSFDYGMSQLEKLNLIPVLNKKVLVEKKPILGICLGMQLFTKRSEEGVKNGLVWVNAETIKFNFTNNQNLKIPHMGWDQIIPKKESKIMGGLSIDSKFYFVHSYFVSCAEENDLLITTDYGNEFASGIEKGNIIGVQFHPEKSHKFGMQLLKNFAELY